jgi:hypothetical protein
MDGRVVDAVIQASALQLYRAHFQVACRKAPANPLQGPCKAPPNALRRANPNPFTRFATSSRRTIHCQHHDFLFKKP